MITLFSRALQGWSFKRGNDTDCLVVGLVDVVLSKRLQMDSNLTLQRALKSVKFGAREEAADHN